MTFVNRRPTAGSRPGEADPWDRLFRALRSPPLFLNDGVGTMMAAPPGGGDA